MKPRRRMDRSGPCFGHNVQVGVCGTLEQLARLDDPMLVAQSFLNKVCISRSLCMCKNCLSHFVIEVRGPHPVKRSNNIERVSVPCHVTPTSPSDHPLASRLPKVNVTLTTVNARP